MPGGMFLSRSGLRARFGRASAARAWGAVAAGLSPGPSGSSPQRRPRPRLVATDLPRTRSVANAAFNPSKLTPEVKAIYRELEEAERKQIDSKQKMPQLAHTTVMRAMFGNTVITLLKGLAYLKTGSPAMLSETIHTLVDTGNQAILLIGLREASKASDSQHPYGYGRAAFFWALVSALGLFWAGSGVTVYHGLSKLWAPPEMVAAGWETWSILGLSLAIDGWVLSSVVQDLRKTKPVDQSFWAYVQGITDPFVMAVLMEDAAACAGVAIAVAGIGMTEWTHNVYWDVGSSIAIGGLLGGVAVYLVRMNQRLLLGQSVDRATEKNIQSLLMSRPAIEAVHSVQSQWVGPAAFNYKAEVDFDGTYLAAQLHREYEPMFVESTHLKADLPLMLAWYAEDVTRLVEKEVKASESPIRESFPQAVHIELEPDSKDKNIPAYQQTTEKKEREAMDQALDAVQQVLRARVDKG